MKRSHGMWGTRIYGVWSDMHKRCLNSKSESYHNYGGRGIKVCERWNTFENFYADMGDAPIGKSLDRINFDGDYEPKNCRWATRAEQQRNRRSNRLLTFDGKTMCMREWERQLGFNIGTVQQRLNRGWSVEAALTEPRHINRWR